MLKKLLQSTVTTSLEFEFGLFIPIGIGIGSAGGQQSRRAGRCHLVH
jgi:hypothetical protein